MAPHVIIDQYNLVITLLITIAWQLTGFFIAWTLQVGIHHIAVEEGTNGQFDKITDFTGGSNFFILALITLCTGGSESIPQIRFVARLTTSLPCEEHSVCHFQFEKGID